MPKLPKVGYILIASFAFCLSADRAAAQVEGIIAGEARKPLYAPELKGEDDQPKLLTERCPCNPWSVDFLIGIPTGIRVQRFFDSEKNYGWMGEAFVGTELNYLGVGGGLRYATIPWAGEKNSFSINPGIDYYWFAGDTWGEATSFGVIAVDADFVWRHVYSERVSGNIGLKIGFGIFHHNRDFLPFPLPVFSWFAGLRF